jgi:AraC family transcriptional regulator, transcriptional activator of pobA
MFENRRDIPFVNLSTSTDAAFFITPVIRDFDPVAWDEKPHRHNFQEIIWVKNGRGKHIIDEKTLKLKPHTFYFIAQGQIHDLLEANDMEGYLIRFANDFLPVSTLQSSAFYTSLFIKVSAMNEITIPVVRLKEYEVLIQQLFQEYQKIDIHFGKQAIIQHLLLVLLIKLGQEIFTPTLDVSKETDTNKVIYHRFLSLLEEQYYKNHLLSSYALQLGIVTRKLSDIIKDFSGKSAKQLILDRAMLEAKRLLTYTDNNLKEITYNLGFEDPAYFSRVFKSQTGVTPVQYKKQKQKRG